MTRTDSLVLKLWHDQSGFVLTAELILISTLLVLGLIVGLTSVQSAVLGELEDVGSAIGSLNQSYQYQGFVGQKGVWGAGWCGGVKAYTAGSGYYDLQDECDANSNHAMSCALSGSILGTNPAPEGGLGSDKHDKRPLPRQDQDKKPSKDKKDKKKSDDASA